MDIFYVKNNGEIKTDSTNNRNYTLKKLHEIGHKYLNANAEPSKFLTTDMDGVLIVDDNALDLCKIIAGEKGEEYFKKVAGGNLKAVLNGETSYCWNAPCVFVGSLLKGLPSQINNIIGQYMRFVPGAEQNIEQLLTLDYDITNVTAGHQEGANEISNRLGINRTIATQFGVNDKIYTGEIVRFIGGIHKFNAVKELLILNDYWIGSHIGDSHSDIETMQGHPASIAWNPAHKLAVHSATINVFGNNKRGLTPFYDIYGELDAQISNTDLPEKIVIYEGRDNIKIIASQISASSNINSEISSKQSEWGQEMRKKYTKELESTLPYTKMITDIKKKIEKETGMKEINFQDHLQKVNNDVFLPLDQFQKNALKAYKEL